MLFCQGVFVCLFTVYLYLYLLFIYFITYLYMYLVKSYIYTYCLVVWPSRKSPFRLSQRWSSVGNPFVESNSMLHHVMFVLIVFSSRFVKSWQASQISNMSTGWPLLALVTDLRPTCYRLVADLLPACYRLVTSCIAAWKQSGGSSSPAPSWSCSVALPQSKSRCLAYEQPEGFRRCCTVHQNVHS